MRIYVRKNPSKFHPDAIWNERALGLFWKVRPNNVQNKHNKMSSNMRSVPGLKIAQWTLQGINLSNFPDSAKDPIDWYAFQY